MTTREWIPLRLTQSNLIALAMLMLALGGIVVQLGRVVQEVNDIKEQMVYLRGRIDGLIPPPRLSHRDTVHSILAQRRIQ